MERIKEHFKTWFEQDKRLLSLLAIDNPFPYNPLIDGLDLRARRPDREIAIRGNVSCQL